MRAGNIPSLMKMPLQIETSGHSNTRSTGSTLEQLVLFRVISVGGGRNDVLCILVGSWRVLRGFVCRPRRRHLVSSHQYPCVTVGRGFSFALVRLIFEPTSSTFAPPTLLAGLSNRPSIRTGIGGLMINGYAGGLSAFLKRTRVDACVQLTTNVYPGVFFRFAEVL